MKGLTIEQRLLVRTTENLETGCWECDYGSWTVKIGDKKSMKFVRYLYNLWIGEVSSHLEVCHTCDNQRCINPEHWWLGTHRENMKDMVLKGRQRTPIIPREKRLACAARGDKHGFHTHPENWSRGDNHWTRTNPEKLNPPKGVAHYSYAHPEKVCRGKKHWHAKEFSNFEIEFIKYWRSRGYSQQSIANSFKTSQSYISGVVRDKNWACKKENRYEK